MHGASNIPMPNLMTHINMAVETIAALDDSYLIANKGSFILGSVSPDIRAITKWPRECTHFVPLNVKEIGSGTQAMFEKHPGLGHDSSTNSQTRAFLAGYISHLALDETWITQVYQPYLADINSFSNPVEATIADRVIQLDVDRMARSSLSDGRALLQSLENSEDKVEIGFISHGLLRDWRVWVGKYIQEPFSWNRLHFLVQRSHKKDHTVNKQVELFLESLDVNLDRMYARLPTNCIGLFTQESITRATRLIRHYLY